MWAPFFIIVIHFVADFICQTDKMAQNKSKDNWWLSIHVSTYTLVSFVGWTMLFFMQIESLTVPDVLLISGKFLAITFITHWMTDYVTSRINARLWKQKKNHWFFVGVGADQVIHYGCLFLTYEYLIK